ncbi:unnamed protein product, partial [Prorocentrum cordatum]
AGGPPARLAAGMGFFACLRGGGREDREPDAGDVRTPTMPCRRTPPAGRRRADRGAASGPGRPHRPGGGGLGDAGGGACFPVRVPDGCVPGQSIRVEAPSGGLVDVVLPPRCQPGQELLVRPSGAPTEPDPRRERLSEFVEMVRLTLSATKSSTRSLRERLSEEVEMQKVLWKSAAKPTLRGAAADKLLHIQALVLLAAEMGEVQQLVAALEEAKQVCGVSPSLEHAARELCSSEEAALTWRCLLDSLVASDVEGSQVWLEQAKAFGLSVPDDLVSTLEDLACAGAEGQCAGGPVTVTARPSGRRRPRDGPGQSSEGGQAPPAEGGQSAEVERRLRFAVEAGEHALLAEAVAEAEAAGLGHTEAAQQAASLLREGGGGAPAGPRGAGPDAGAPGAAGAGAEDLGGRSARELLEAALVVGRPGAGGGCEQHLRLELLEALEECRRRCLDTAGCTTREDLIGLLRGGRAGADPRATPRSAGAALGGPGAAAGGRLAQEHRPPAHSRAGDFGGLVPPRELHRVGAPCAAVPLRQPAGKGPVAARPADDLQPRRPRRGGRAAGRLPEGGHGDASGQDAESRATGGGEGGVPEGQGLEAFDLVNSTLR